ncbi:MAG: hypothetical protein E6Q71_04730 [Pseudomonas sp.]|nr:MAG: hypothetical protein E6Q71_04730 [Pseudomonas sp.]
MTSSMPQVITVLLGRRQGACINYDIQLAGRRYQVYFACADLALTADAEAALAMLALGAMSTSSELRVEELISQLFVENQRRLMGIFAGWFDRYRPVAIQAPRARVASPAGEGRVGCFFTGGVDSFYTFLKHREEITDLVFVHGYDVDLDDQPRREQVSAMGRALEQACGIRFIELESNAIRLFRDYGRWGTHAHGYGLGSAARHLAGYLRRIYVPSSFATAELMPWASHPDTDPLFSDERLEVIHDGCEAGRVDKVRALAADALALRHLRVCWERVEGAYNCGQCEKCLRTMTSLQALGVLSQCSVFAPEVDVRLVRRLVIHDASLATFARDNLRLLEANGQSGGELAQAWSAVLERPQWRNWMILKGRKWRRRGLRILGKLGVRLAPDTPA